MDLKNVTYNVLGEELLFWVPEEYLDKFYLPLERRGHIHSLLLAALGKHTNCSSFSFKYLLDTSQLF